MLAIAGPGDTILVNRDAHKSVISALLLSGAKPGWVEPRYDMDLHLAHPPGINEVKAALSKYPEAKGMVLASPTDYGTCANIRGITRLLHEYDKPIIVDEAWGAVFPFHQAMPQWGMNVEADLCVTSVHKTGAGFEQSSVFHLQGNRIDPAVLKNRKELLSTTSTSSLIYAALDGWRRYMMMDGKDRLAATLELSDRAVREIRRIGLYKVYDEWVLCGPNKSFEIDRQKIVIDVSGLGISGYQASDWLLDHCGLVLGVADHRRIAALLTYADDETSVEILVDSLSKLSHAAHGLPEPKPVKLFDNPQDYQLEQAMLPRDAFFAKATMMEADNAVGRISAEMITPYPPGVPMIVPGEVFTKPVIDYLRSGLAAGMVLQDMHDSSLKSFRVVE